MNEDKIKIIFRGKILRKCYYVEERRNHYDDYYNEKPHIEEMLEEVKYKNFYECEITRPPYEESENVYINDLDLEVYIYSKMRSINNEYIYKTNHVIEIIEDEISNKYKQEAEQQLTEELVKYNDYINKKAEEKNKKWFQFWK